MLQEHIALAIISGTVKVEAKDEKQAVQKLNQMMKNPEGYGYKVYKSNGYFGKYELGKTWKGKKQGATYAEFNLAEKEPGIYGIGYPYNGYNGID